MNSKQFDKHIERGVVALERIADALDAKNQTDREGKEMATAFIDFIKGIVEMPEPPTVGDDIIEKMNDAQERFEAKRDAEPPTVGDVVEPMKIWCVACKSDVVEANAPMVLSRANPDVWVCLSCGKTVKAVVEPPTVGDVVDDPYNDPLDYRQEAAERQILADEERELGGAIGPDYDPQADDILEARDVDISCPNCEHTYGVRIMNPGEADTFFCKLCHHAWPEDPTLGVQEGREGP